uniref:hypothetical protein n=1 Tax=Streptomyces tunisiensis TaxID=948699 RepID=UPI003988AD96
MGAGPAGLTPARLLRLAGIDCRPGVPRPRPRGAAAAGRGAGAGRPSGSPTT